MSEATSELEGFKFDEPETADDAARRMIAGRDPKVRGKGVAAPLR